MIFIIGHEGAMGRRYRAILNHLGVKWVGADKYDLETVRHKHAERCDGIIVATPTETHCSMIKEFAPYRKPMLVEKPFSKDMYVLQSALFAAKAANCPLNMVYQYKELDHPGSKGLTLYNYWRHGSDGLVWDCIQLVGVARGECVLKEACPIWLCELNGKRVSIEQMDHAYISMIKNWMANPGQDLIEIQDIHQKTHEMAAAWNKRKSS